MNYFERIIHFGRTKRFPWNAPKNHPRFGQKRRRLLEKIMTSQSLRPKGKSND